MTFLRLLIVAAMSLAGDFSIAGAMPNSNAPAKPFLVFDGLIYRNKPDLGAFGMLPIRGINPPVTGNGASDGVDDAKVQATLQIVQGYRGVVYLDYEIWPTFHESAAVVSENIKKLSRVAKLTRAGVPGAKVGFYNVIPCWDYWGLVKNDEDKIREWQDCNARIDELAQRIDIVMPSLYTFYNDQQGWDVYATALLQAARRYHKPVYAFLWPEFHVSNRLLRGQNLPASLWRHELEFCKARADGVVIWGGWQEPWDENADWWMETKSFLAGLNAR